MCIRDSSCILVKIFDNVVFLDLNWLQDILQVLRLVVYVTHWVVETRGAQQILRIVLVYLGWRIFPILLRIIVQIDRGLIKRERKEEFVDPVLVVKIKLLMLKWNNIALFHQF